METAFSKVTSALTACGSSRHRNGNWNCPSHDDNSPSLSVNPAEHFSGVILDCHAGCMTSDIVSALGLEMKDLFDEQEPSREVDRYDYRDLDGTVLYAKFRYDPKGFSIKHDSGNGWQPGIGGAKRVLYRLPELIEGIAGGKTVFLPEGEKDVNRLVKEGYVATTNFEGAGKWRPEYTQCFEGANVIIIADRDEAGYAHANIVKQNLSGHARNVKIVQSKTGDKKDDVTDHLNAGYTVAELVPLTADTPITKLYNPINWFHAWKESSEDPDWLFEPVLEAGTINALFGKPGVGKSLITLEMAMSIAKRGRPVVYVDDENRIQDTVERLKAFSCRPEDLDKLHMYSFAGLPALDTPDGGQHLAALADRHEAALVVLDTTSRMVSGDENQASTYLQLYRCALVPLKARGVTVLRLDHPGKDDTRGQRGSSAKLGDIDTLWKLSYEGNDLLTLEREKSRSGHGESTIVIKRRSDPLRHDWDALEALPTTPQVYAIAQWLDEHEVPRWYGRPKLRVALDSIKGAPRCDTNVLAVVARYRKKLERDIILSASQDKSSSQQEVVGHNE